MSLKEIGGVELGQEMYQLITRLFPITRSITGDGVRQTLNILKEYVPLTIHEVPSGTKVFDWEVPDEWNIRDAYVKDEEGNRVIDYNKSNLHLVGYSIPFEGRLSLNELKEHLHTLPDQPDYIPYVTSYYKKDWGFCLSYSQYQSLKDEIYEIKIDSTLQPGSLTYGELIIKGLTDKEVLFSTYICHPSMANNELSGPVVATFLAKSILEEAEPPRYTYRFIFIPETIGSITYLSFHKDTLKKKLIAGYVLTCLGNSGSFSYVMTRAEGTLTDRVALHALKHSGKKFRLYRFFEGASDERQYNFPGIDLPVGSIMKAKYGTYPEYHTSADDLSFVTPEALKESFDMYKECIFILEHNDKYQATTLCEPQLGRRGLYPTLSRKSDMLPFRTIKYVLAYCDDDHDVLAIADTLGRPFREVESVIDVLEKHRLIRRIDMAF